MLTCLNAGIAFARNNFGLFRRLFSSAAVGCRAASCDQDGHQLISLVSQGSKPGCRQHLGLRDQQKPVCSLFAFLLGHLDLAGEFRRASRSARFAAVGADRGRTAHELPADLPARGSLRQGINQLDDPHGKAGGSVENIEVLRPHSPLLTRRPAVSQIPRHLSPTAKVTPPRTAVSHGIQAFKHSSIRAFSCPSMRAVP